MDLAQVTFSVNGERWFIRTTDDTPAMAEGSSVARRAKKDPTDDGSVGSPMPGVIVDVKVKEGAVVAEGDTLFVLSAMKMETAIKAGKAGEVKSVLVNSGDNVDGDDLLAVVG